MLAPTLPDLSKLDREALQALLLAEHEERMATHQRLLSRESEIEHLKLLLSQLRRMQFGRKSEKLERQIEQLELRLEDLQQAEPAGERPASRVRAIGATSPRCCCCECKAAGVHCPSICHARRRPMCRDIRLAQTVAGSYASSAKTFPRCWSTCQRASR